MTHGLDLEAQTICSGADAPYERNKQGDVGEKSKRPHSKPQGKQPCRKGPMYASPLAVFGERCFDNGPYSYASLLYRECLNM